MTRLSPAELSYLKESLKSTTPIRPDARLASQFRPLEASTNFLPSANGSARVRLSDGGECIVGVKAKVVKTADADSLVQVEVDIPGIRDDHLLPNVLSSTLVSALQPVIQPQLKLTSRFSYKLFVDALILSHSSSHPLNIISLTTYLALCSTKLPKIVSSTDDSTAEEIPVFHDDWDQSIPLCNPVSRPPLFFLMAIVGDNVFVDPTAEEEMVSDTGIFIGWNNDRAVGPIRTVDLGSHRNGIRPNVIKEAYKLLEEIGSHVVKALDGVLEAESSHDEFTTAMF